jgi:hypothetical protein
MQLSFDKLLPKLQPYIAFVRKYAMFLFIVALLGVYGFLVQRIGHFIQDEPAQSAIDSKLKPVNQLKIDQDAIKKITDLESQNVEVKSLFEQVRQNPFTE